MKKSLSLVFALLLLTACTNENTKTENTKGSSTTVTSTVKKSSNYSINEKNILSTNTTTTSTADRKSSQTEEEQSHTEDPASLSSFVGGWGIPQSGNFFFINPDGKMSGSGQPNGVIQSPNFLSNADGSITMNFIINNTSLSFTKNLDGTLSTENQIYSYLGNIALEQWLELKNKGQMSSEQQTGILEASSQTP